MHMLTSMTGQHITNHCKLLFSEYGWPETLISGSGPCYTAEVFTNLIREYNANHITSSPHYPQSNGLAEKYVQLVKNLFYKAKEEGKDLFKCLMVNLKIHCQTLLVTNANNSKQICKIRHSYLKCSQKTSRNRLREVEKKVQNEHLPSHDLYMDQVVMYQDSTRKWWFPATITKLCQEPRSYIITTKEGVQYRKHKLTWNHISLKSRKLKMNIYCKIIICRQSKLNSKSHKIDNLAQCRPKRDIKPPVKLDL